MNMSTSPHPANRSVHRHIESGVALTFDDGPDRQFTLSILDHLANTETVATFFVVGELISSNEDVVRRIVDDGHEVAAHGWHHVRHSKLSDHEIQTSLDQTADALQAVTGVFPRLFRPPYGDHDVRLVEMAAKLGQSVWLWSVDARDWERPGSEEIVRRVVENVENGSVVLLHDGRGNRWQTVEAVPSVIAMVGDLGYSFARIPHSA